MQNHTENKANLNSFFNFHNPKWIKLVTILRTGLSHLRERKFKHSFNNAISLSRRMFN